MKKKNTLKKVLWGLAFVLVAVVILFDVIGKSVGFLPQNGLALWQILLGLLCVFVAIWGIAHRWFWLPFPMLAALFLIFEADIANLFGAPSADLAPTWAILVGAGLLSIGAIILTPRRKVKKHTVRINPEDGPTEYVSTGERASANSAGARTIYIDCNDFTEEVISNKFGAYAVYFLNTESYKGDGTLIVNNNMGAVEIHLPDDWNADVTITGTFGALDTPSLRPGGKILHVTGSNNMGAIDIHRDSEEDRDEDGDRDEEDDENEENRD